jgi:chaperone modulatory protein CbpM
VWNVPYGTDYSDALEIETLEVWIKEEWLIPRQDATSQEFFEVDIARAHLIKDLKHGRQR